MNKPLIYTTILSLPTMLLSACGSITLGIQPPGNGGGSGDVTTNTLLYVLMGAAVLIALVALTGRKSS